MSSVDISGLSKEDIVRAIWKATPYCAFFKHAPLGVELPQLTDEDIRDCLHIKAPDYLCGKLWRLGNLSKDMVNPSSYDRDMGAGAFKKIIDDLRASQES